MKAYKNKLKRDFVGSGDKYGVYLKAIRGYLKGEEVFIGTISSKDRILFDSLIKKIK
jgi:hypothetical protein